MRAVGLRPRSSAAVMVWILSVGGCGDNRPGIPQDTPFDTFDDCFLDRHGPPGFSPPRAIELCCMRNPIAGNGANQVCGDALRACIYYVTTSLSGTGVGLRASTDQIEHACIDYLVERPRSEF